MVRRLASQYSSLVLLIVILLGGCAITDLDPMRPATAWFYGPPPGTSTFRTELGQSRWRKVPAPHRASANTKLAANAFISLTEQQAAALEGPGLKIEGCRPFLLRGVDSASGNAEMRVYENDAGDILVDGESLSRTTVTVQRQPVVAWLERPPHRVFVTYAVAE